MDTFFAVTAPGLEPLTAQELRQLKLLPAAEAGQGKDRRSSWSLPGETAGGISFEGELEALYRANLHLRTASRVLVRLGEFVAVSFPEFVKKASRLPWERYLTPGQPVNLHVTCHKSRLYHSGAVAERVLRQEAARLGIVAPSDVVRDSVFAIPGLRGPDGQFSRQVFDSFLRAGTDGSRRASFSVHGTHAWSIDDDSRSSGLELAANLRPSRRLSLSAEQGPAMTMTSSQARMVDKRCATTMQVIPRSLMD